MFLTFLGVICATGGVFALWLVGILHHNLILYDFELDDTDSDVFSSFVILATEFPSLQGFQNGMCHFYILKIDQVIFESAWLKILRGGILLHGA